VKIAVSSLGTSLDSQVDPRFGRCQHVLLVDSDTMEFESISNSSVESPHGAGIGAAQLIASRGAKALLTGSVGPNAYSALTAAGIKVYTGISGSVREAVERLIKGELPQTTEPTVGGHHGMGFGAGQGRGRRGA
jgi:predicted Fe-Mo cluster-binding NifX family protein